MVIYKYDPNFYKADPEDKEFCEKHNIVYFSPSKELEIWLQNWLKTAKLPVINTKPDIVCYWRSFGTWGMYHPEDYSISICPYKIEEAPGGLEGTIKHEILHLQHPELNDMDHLDKEDAINDLG